MTKELRGSRYHVQIYNSNQYVEDIQRQVKGNVSEFPMHLYVLLDVGISLTQDTNKKLSTLPDFLVTSFLTKCKRQIKGTDKWCKGKNIHIERTRTTFEAVYALADLSPQLDDETFRELLRISIEDAVNSLMDLRSYLKSALIKAPKLSRDLESIFDSFDEILNPSNIMSVCRLGKKRTIYSMPAQSTITTFAEVISCKG